MILLPPMAAAAQQGPRRPVAPEEGTQVPPGLRIADLKIGPFYLQPRVSVSNFGWDNNVTGLPEGQGRAADFRATPGGGLKIAIPIREAHLITADGQLDYLWYADTKQLRTFNGAAVTRYEYSSARFGLSLQNRYVNAQRTQTDLIEIGDETVAPEYEVFEAARQISNISSASGSWNVSQKFFLRGRASRSIIRFQEIDPESTDLSERLDRTEDSAGGSLGFHLTPKTALALVVDWTNYDYETPGNPRDAETYRAGVEVDLDPTALIEGRALIGYRDLAPREPEVVGFEGVVLDAEIGAQPGGLADVTVSGVREAFPSLFATNAYYLRQGGGVAVLLQAVRGLAFGAEVTAHEHSYPEPASQTLPDGSVQTAKRLDRIYRFLGRIEWRRTSSNRIGLRIGWVRRQSNFGFAQTDGLVIGTSYSLVY